MQNGMQHVQGNMVEGLRIDADDYMTRPFSPRLLVAQEAAAARPSATELARSR
jgi:DNA-binding response OmpR family regulator